MRKAVIQEKSMKWNFDFGNTEKPIMPTQPVKHAQKVSSPKKKKSPLAFKTSNKENSIETHLALSAKKPSPYFN